ncbi:NAD-dependent epimerase/dehydratase family protein [Paenibacillus sp. UMB4589-SE434]|uniref:NAD-dependent epimerase/dehydratase family protein n=1 Tax=Paenibacillus sp. UMB4589-SE434 TaxID=3046314 RepID=UPI0025503E91|nr:NAD-dependent epimerase/dehydratase family protein [Paenibacillus sp. UMB4589-SE434]MDK8181981.1 NAD-dependent epimerase/dehydratase family protein [Paenibacillus sp. UMB4589-SE434]
MTKVLVLGGTRFFGKKLVQLLLEDGTDVTLVTRGQTVDTFGDQVKRLQLDRTDQAALAAAVGESEWDVVYDNICFFPQDALSACEIFAGKVKRYIFTSTMAVYEFGDQMHPEDDFNPYTYPIPVKLPTEPSYAEGKQLAEAVLFQQAPFPVCAVRFPIVLGTDDYTERLLFHIERVQQGLPIGIPNLDAVMGFITSDEAARFLFWLKNQHFEGPVNARSDGELSIGQIMKLIEAEVGTKALIEKPSAADDTLKQADGSASPFGITASWRMDTSKAVQHGFEFDKVAEWYPRLIKELALGSESNAAD